MDRTVVPPASWYANLLTCPDCAGPILGDVGLSCSKCGFRDESGRDLRPQHPRGFHAILPRTLAISVCDALREIDTTRPSITYDGPNAIRDSRELLSEISRRCTRQNGTVLDLGCGPRDQAAPISYLGYSYVGLDYCNANADLLGDAHSIPFKDNAFDCVLSYAVLEHLHSPFITIREVERVLKPGGIFVGTVSQGEPFHESFFHHTPWGLLSLVATTDSLRVVRLWEAPDTLWALSRIGRYPRVIRGLLRTLDCINRRLPLLAPRKMRWPVKDKQLDRLYRSGSLCFVIERV